MTPTRDAFEARLRQIGAERYHDRHPFHHMLHGGHCTPDQVRAWVINRYYYQSRIPMKDAAFLSRVDDPDLRRIWRSFVREKPLLEAVAASLTELFAPKIHAQRIEGLLANYAFADDSSLAYFRNRLKEAPKDVAFGLKWVLDRADTTEKQDAAAAALTFKTDVLWSQLDALSSAYVDPARIPPGAWHPGEGLLAKGAA